MKKLSLITSLILLAAAISSCTAHKKTPVPVQPVAYEWLVANLDIQPEGNNLPVDELAGQLRMRRDSLLWLSVTATMGVEVARIKVSNDSVWFVNRSEKTYLAEPIETVVNRFGIPLSINWLQSLLFDNNEGFPPTENQTVLLRLPVLGNYSAKIKYHNLRLDEETSFPLKITNKMERIKLPDRP